MAGVIELATALGRCDANRAPTGRVRAGCCGSARGFGDRRGPALGEPPPPHPAGRTDRPGTSLAAVKASLLQKLEDKLGPLKELDTVVVQQRPALARLSTG